MDRFFDQQNVERYRQLASASISDSERRSLLTLLAAEEAEFKTGVRFSQPPGAPARRAPSPQTKSVRRRGLT